MKFTTNHYNYSLTRNQQDWQHLNPECLQQVLLDQPSLELAPGRESVETLVVEKARYKVLSHSAAGLHGICRTPEQLPPSSQ